MPPIVSPHFRWGCRAECGFRSQAEGAHRTPGQRALAHPARRAVIRRQVRCFDVDTCRLSDMRAAICDAVTEDDGLARGARSRQNLRD